MSKKTRKKSPNTPAGKPARPKSERKPKKASSKSASRPAKTSAKARKPAAKKSAKRASNRPGNAPAKASHRAPSKALKPSGPDESVAQAAAPGAPAAKSPALKKPTMHPASSPKTGAAAPRPLGLSEGATAPDFQLPRDDGDTVSLDDFKGRKLVLFFYPRADTPGCTKEAIDFSRLSAAFAENQTAVLGVSADPPKVQQAFRDKHLLVTPLVSDEQHEMLDAYGVWGEKTMYGRIFQGILRTTVLVGADRRILRTWRNVKVDGHAEEVLAAVRAL
ncbi:peroxiredoxin [Bradyrhizobium sp.]|uniref:peroxiredoxin n=1 Tax=Bradyrhizobium sp. TaxID=376 RepID=UPI000A8411B3|nr:peroxiredoxin [Bradyrhizobium sp.]